MGAGRYALVDDDDAELVAGHTWRLVGRVVVTNMPSETAAAGRTTVTMRRLIMGVTDRRVVVGHRNGDPLDHQRANLGIGIQTPGPSDPLPLPPPPPSPFHGVYWRGRRQAWGAWVTIDGVNLSLGVFTDQIEAAKAYDQAARKHCCGPSVMRNFPTDAEVMERAAWLIERRAARRAARDA